MWFDKVIAKIKGSNFFPKVYVNLFFQLNALASS